MDILSKHTIKQQILEITIPNADDHEEITTALSEIYKKNIDGLLDDICDGLIPSNEIVRIDSLTVDLGHLEFEQLETGFPKAIKNAVRELLFKKIRDKDISLISSGKVSDQNKQKALLFYLATGLLPWYYEGNLQKLKQEFSSKRIIATDALLKTLKDLESRKRAIQFFEEKALANFLLEKLPRDKRIPLLHLKTLKDCLGKLKNGSETLDITVSKSVNMLLQALKHKSETYQVVMEQFIQQLVDGHIQGAKQLLHVLPIKYRLELQSFLQRIEWTKKNVFSADEISLLQTLNTTFELMQQREFTDEVAERKFELDKKSQVNKKLELDGGIAIENAGLILVWPYLESFFTGLGLMQERLFLDNGSGTKAIQLLHYLVFKNEEGDETEWLLNKILCGMDPTDFISENFDLDQAQKEECEHLLSAVISNWPALKNTSPDSLRKTFLQREGLLAPYNNGWILKIERKAYDVLLDRLPWAISVVKIPWNDYLITTEW